MKAVKSNPQCFSALILIFYKSSSFALWGENQLCTSVCTAPSTWVQGCPSHHGAAASITQRTLLQKPVQWRLKSGNSRKGQSFYTVWGSIRLYCLHGSDSRTCSLTSGCHNRQRRDGPDSCSTREKAGKDKSGLGSGQVSLLSTTT